MRRTLACDAHERTRLASARHQGMRDCPGFKIDCDVPMQNDSSLNVPTPTASCLPLRRADFANLAEALDYAARGETGANFYSGHGELLLALPYRALREEALTLARRLASLDLPRSSRVAIVAETNPDFLRFFFACQYVGLVPVALPSVINLGGHAAYVERLHGMLRSCGAAVAVASDQLLPFLREAVGDLELVRFGAPDVFHTLPESAAALHASGPDEIAYLQFTSGSTGFPRAVVIDERTVLANLHGAVNHGLDMRSDDRFVSWLPFYHDMGLIGCLLAVVTTQRSVDYLDTRAFAMRPRLWLDLITRNRGTVAYSPPFGYELCAHRVRPQDVASYDLSSWRVAGIGAEPIRADVMERFAEMLAPAGFDEHAFVASYGMAECSVAISFSPLQQGILVDWVDADELSDRLRARPAAEGRRKGFVRCGSVLPAHEVMICDAAGHKLPELAVGRIMVRGPSVMSGYFGMPEETRKVLSADGWLDTGDTGYLADGSIVVTGRSKDMIIINGRNIWPQDIERIAERQPELRSQGASAFGVPSPDGTEKAVVVVQCADTHALVRDQLVTRLRREIHEQLGITCLVELVPRHTLPRTSSGKLSRSATRAGYLQRRVEEDENVKAADADELLRTG